MYLSKNFSPFGCDINGKNNKYIFAPNIIILRPEVLLLFIILSLISLTITRQGKTQKPVN